MKKKNKIILSVVGGILLFFLVVMFMPLFQVIAAMLTEVSLIVFQITFSIVVILGSLKLLLVLKNKSYRSTMNQLKKKAQLITTQTPKD